MARKVKKMGDAPRVETIVADGAETDVILTWESRQYENGLTEWVQPAPVLQSRDLTVHSWSQKAGWSLAMEGYTTIGGYRTAEDAMAVCQSIVRHRLTPAARRLRAAAAGGDQ